MDGPAGPKHWPATPRQLAAAALRGRCGQSARIASCCSFARSMLKMQLFGVAVPLQCKVHCNDSISESHS